MISKEQIKTAYDSAPEDIQNIFFAEDFTKTLADITQKYHFHIDQSGVLSEKVSAVILGLIRREDFNRELRQSLGISDDIVNLVIYDLNQSLFNKIRQIIEKNSPEMQTRTPETSTPTAPTAPVATPAPVAPSATMTQPSIGQPSIPNPSTPQIFDDKMTGVSNVPKQEVVVAPQTGDNKARDPYREPAV